MCESLIYVINSTEKTNSGTGVTYDIDFGNLNSQYDDFMVEVIGCSINETVLAGDPIVLTAENFANTGSFCSGLLNSNECVVSILNTDSASLSGSTGIMFKASDLRRKRRITFNMRTMDMALATSTTDINVGSDTIWMLTLKLTPLS